MPAGSEPPGPAATPTRFRPLGVRIAAVFLVVTVFLTAGAIWLAFPDDVRASFTPAQRVTVLLMGAGTAAVAHALARCRVDADDAGITVVNGYRTHRFAWGQVVAVWLRSGAPWAVLDLSDGTSQPAMGIQGSDGRRARDQVTALRRLLDEHAGQEPRP